MQNALPLTGGIGLWWLFGLGGAALVASFIKRKN
ncbi:LPXTG cell wall anchor domain-containing protein [Corynebacterium sp. SCR221107]|nr:LPXTG cell wall anchor domain-containing protein [Corynebacterium sp. SCR221107]WBT08191.1 LPXTG cell wall anchor domain-containing protein [Corynebacterium sp. SCR221107]